MSDPDAHARPVRIAVTIGDVNGIGPEVALEALDRADVRRDVDPVLVGPSVLWRRWADRLDVAIDGRDWTVESTGRNEVGDDPDWLEAGRIAEESGRVAMRAVERAIDLCREGRVDAMVTAPISKEAVVRAGWRIPGHTEFIADRVQSARYAMMMVVDELRVAVLTTHVPVRRVADAVTRGAVRRKVAVVLDGLRDDFGCTAPTLAVLGLNPHAGDGGVIGREDEEVLRPVVEEFRRDGADVTGPHAADAFFARRAYERTDGVLACYHDQGLIPFKMKSRRRGVNVTVGLPIVRTSPDHGTAFDIAGTGRADPSSMAEAVMVAVRIARRRRRNEALESNG